MASEDQEETARYYQGLANQAEDQAKELAKTEAVGVAESARIQQQINGLQIQRQLAITNAERERLDNSIKFNTTNLEKNNSAVAQLQQQRNTALAQVTANQTLANEAVGGPPAAKNIPGPAAIPAPPFPPPSTIPVTPAATPQPDFVNDPNTGEQVPSDSVQADEIRAGQNRVDSRSPEPVAGSTDSGVLDPQQQAALAIQNPTAQPVNDFVRDPVTGEQVPSDSNRAAEILAEAAAEEQVQVNAPEPVPGSTDPGLLDPAQRAQQAAQQAPLTPEQQAAKEQAAAKENAINQATRQSVYKQGGSTDWRVRLQLSPSSNYLYNAEQPGILGPLFATNGVLFPYTPQIQTSYEAKYTDYDLVHSNFRGVFYQNSRVGDISIRAEFTAQDSNEANYLLAVIHFFRSVTKMFYGKDPQRGTPPPLVYLSGLGMNQFYGHPCLVRQFQYTLPNNVDYIRASTNNNYGTDLLNRLRPASSPSSVAGLGATGNRILNSPPLRDFLGQNSRPAPNSVVASVNNTQLSNYVPTKMEIDISLIPVQTRSQVSKQFSLENFAKGNLIKNGFW
jgi:hypothetical protein